jgi:hypothetical protein
MAGVALFYSFLLLLYCLFCQTSFFRGIPFFSGQNLGMGYSETHGIPRQEHLFRGIRKAVPTSESIPRNFFLEQNFDANPRLSQRGKLC